jgi:hypothetical protein
MTDSKDTRRPGAHDDADDRAWDREFTAPDDAAELIPDGFYDARVVGRPRTFWFFNKERLHLIFEIVGGGSGGKRVDFYCALNRTRHSRFREAWQIAAGKVAKLDDRMGLRVFRQRLFRIEVGTTTVDRYDRGRTPYSRVVRLVERLA